MTYPSMTLACPEGMVADANSLAMVLGEGPSDGLTFGAPRWLSQSGTGYALARFETAGPWDAMPARSLSRPAWDVMPYRVNMAGAERARAALQEWAGANPASLPADRILVLRGVSVPGVLQALGLTPSDEAPV